MLTTLANKWNSNIHVGCFTFILVINTNKNINQHSSISCNHRLAIDIRVQQKPVKVFWKNQLWVIYSKKYVLFITYVLQFFLLLKFISIITHTLSPRETVINHLPAYHWLTNRLQAQHFRVFPSIPSENLLFKDTMPSEISHTQKNITWSHSHMVPRIDKSIETESNIKVQV